MPSNTPEQDRSLDLAKSGLQHAQSCISHVDAKVGVAVGLLIFLIPAPLAIVSWLFGLSGDTSVMVFKAICCSPYFTTLMALSLLTGMVLACIALFNGLTCLSPQASESFEKEGPFHNQWRPNILFPLFSKSKREIAYKHFERIRDGSNFDFMITEYEHQLQQLGRILEAKIRNMQNCFTWSKRVMIFYGTGLLFACLIAFGGFSSTVRTIQSSASGEIIAVTNAPSHK